MRNSNDVTSVNITSYWPWVSNPFSIDQNLKFHTICWCEWGWMGAWTNTNIIVLDFIFEGDPSNETAKDHFNIHLSQLTDCHCIMYVDDMAEVKQAVHKTSKGGGWGEMG